jgi:F-type H+-transporting ATPase subunit b
MPQLEFDSYYSQIFWLSISFVILYYFIDSYVMPAILQIKQERQDKIETEMHHALENRNKIQGFEDDYIKKKKSLSVIYSQIHKVAEEEYHLFEDKKLKYLNSQNLGLQSRATDEIEKISHELEKGIKEGALRHASFVINNLISKKVNPQDIEKYYNRVTE